jgi:hypothetical protein
LRRELRITRLLNRAIRGVYRVQPDCRLPSPYEQPSTFTDAPLSEALLAAFAVLRRPQTADEAIADDEMPRIPAQNFYRDSYRIPASASGRRYLIAAAQNIGLFQPRPAICAAALRSRFERLLNGRRKAFKRAARRSLDQIVRDEWSSNPDAARPRDVLFMFDLTESGQIGGGGGGAPLDWVLKHGLLGSSQRLSRRSTVSGLIPDGVATVELTFPRSVSRGPYRPPRRYRRTLRITAPVDDNVISVRVNRSAPDAFPHRMVWKDSTGTTVRIVRFPR